MSTEPLVQEEPAVAFNPDGTVVENRRAETRYPGSAVPAITSVNLSGGEPLTLVNISVTGVLVEGATRLRPGERTTLVFAGLEPGQVSGRVVRCVVSTIGKSGALQYQSGIAFDRRIDLPLEEPAPDSASASTGEPAARGEGAVPASNVYNRW